MNDSKEQDRWKRLEALFHMVVDFTPLDRVAYLERHCEDEQLRLEVEALVADAADTGLGNRVLAVSAQLSNSTCFKAGDRVGAWRLIRHIADGGMGSVFEAERADGQYQQRAALKVLRGQLPGGQLADRFVHERQILAQLSHPNVARLLDGGTTDDGLPYLAMEFVAGLEIDQWCQTHKPSLPARLEMVRKICAAVQAAHQNLIVHRDIKPSNILVDASGEPKLLDFGIAKLLQADAASTSPQTQVGQRLLTPEFASPEQIRDLPVGTASDVYSLGVLLYTLLAGRSPYASWRQDHLELQRAVCELSPPRLCAAVPTNVVGGVPVRGLRGDLEHIVARAMRKEPSQRYISASALADDLARYLAAEPVQAREGSRRYLAAKFLRRHWAAMSAGLVTVIIVATLTIFYTAQLQSERDASEQARAAAERQRAAAEQSSSFLASLFRAANADQAQPNLLARDLLQAGAQRIESELAEQPLVQAHLQQTIGRAFWSLALYPEGEAHMRKGLQLLRTHLGPNDPRIAEHLNEMARDLTRRERYDEALAMLEEAERIYQTAFGPEDARIAGVLINQNRIVIQRDHDISEAQRARLDRIEHILVANGRQKSGEFATMLLHRSTFHKQRFEWEQAIKFGLQGVALNTELTAPRHPSLVFNIEDIARLYYFQGDFAKAIPLFEEVIGMVEEFKGPEHVEMGWSLYYRARIAREQGQHALARQLFERLVAIESATPQTPDNRYLARALCGYALVLADAGDLNAARAHCKRGREILLSTRQKRIQMGVIHEGLGVIALAAGDVATARIELAAMAAVRRAEHDPAQTDTPVAIALHGTALAAAGQIEDALRLHDEALALALARYDEDYPTVGRILWSRSRLQRAVADAEQAVADATRAREIFQRKALVAQGPDWRMWPAPD